MSDYYNDINGAYLNLFKKQALYFILLFVVSSNVAGEINVVIPFYTAHFVHDDRSEYGEKKEYSDNVYGLGGEYVTDNDIIFGAIYLKQDSLGNENLLLYSGYNFNETFSAGWYVGLNYETTIISPSFAFNYGYLRLVTTLPIGFIVGGQVDIVSIQLVF